MYSEGLSQQHNKHPRLSVIVPFHGKQEDLTSCLNALRASDHKSFEIIVVDDASPHPLIDAPGLLRLEQQCGPAVARNAGAGKAFGSILLFIDADIVVQSNSLTAFEQALKREDADAVQACYSYPGIATNLATRFLEDFQEFKVESIQTSRIRTLRGGCFAIQSAAFYRAGMFDEGFTEPSQEDTDLGWRIARTGGKIFLDKKIRVLHRRNISNYRMLWLRYFKLLKSMVKLHIRARIQNQRSKGSVSLPEATMSKSNQTWRPLFSFVSICWILGCPWICLVTGTGIKQSVVFWCIGIIFFVWTNSPFLRFVFGHRRKLLNVAGEAILLAGMHVCLFTATVVALIEYPRKRY